MMIKEQVLVDIIVECSFNTILELTNEEKTSSPNYQQSKSTLDALEKEFSWNIFLEEATNSQRSGAGI